MKKETVGPVVFGWAVGVLISYIVVFKIVSIEVTPISFWLMLLLPVVYFLFSIAAGFIAEGWFRIEFTSRVRWVSTNFLMGLLSPLVVVVYVVPILLATLGLVVFGVLSPLFPASVEFEFPRNEREKDLEFLRAFDAESWKRLPKQENDLPDGESGSPCVYDDEKDTFSIMLYGDITREAIKALKSFAEDLGYVAVKIKTYG